MSLSNNDGERVGYARRTARGRGRASCYGRRVAEFVSHDVTGKRKRRNVREGWRSGQTRPTRCRLVQDVPECNAWLHITWSLLIAGPPILPLDPLYFTTIIFIPILLSSFLSYDLDDYYGFRLELYR